MHKICVFHFQGQLSNEEESMKIEAVITPQKVFFFYSIRLVQFASACFIENKKARLE